MRRFAAVGTMGFMMKNIQCLVFSVMLFMATSGCSLFAPSTQTISVDGQPSGALVVINGKPFNAPCSCKVKRNRNVEITVSQKGYFPYTMKSGYSLSTTGMLDLAGAAFFLVPAVGFVSPGAFVLEQDTFYYTLTPMSSEKQ